MHHIVNVPYAFDSRWRSAVSQSTLSIAWTLLGSGLMAVAGLRLKQRDVWIVGSTLLGFVVLKLFIVYLADIGTVSRIISFIRIGLTLLMIGHFAPLPPNTGQSAEQP